MCQYFIFSPHLSEHVSSLCVSLFLWPLNGVLAFTSSSLLLCLLQRPVPEMQGLIVFLTPKQVSAAVLLTYSSALFYFKSQYLTLLPSPFLNVSFLYFPSSLFLDHADSFVWHGFAVRCHPRLVPKFFWLQSLTSCQQCHLFCPSASEYGNCYLLDWHF